MNYINKMHRWGRAWAVITCAMIFAFPFALAIVFNAWPDFGVFLTGLFGVAVTFWPVGIIEVITYTPMLGVGGTYLSFVTGNLTSLKVPCALDAMEKAEVKADSDEGEVISTIAIATSSIVTILIILVGVILIMPLLSLMEQFPQISYAFDNVLPALFGGLGVVFIAKNVKLAIAPVILMLALFITIPALNSGTVGIMVPVGVIFTLVVARIMYKKGML